METLSLLHSHSHTSSILYTYKPLTTTNQAFPLFLLPCTRSHLFSSSLHLHRQSPLRPCHASATPGPPPDSDPPPGIDTKACFPCQMRQCGAACSTQLESSHHCELKAGCGSQINANVKDRHRFVDGLAASLSKFQDRVQIFLAVLFWMSLFFWASAWDGRDRPNKGSRFRR